MGYSTRQQLEDWLSQVRYKPNCDFQYLDGGTSGHPMHKIRIGQAVPDSNGGDHAVYIHATRYVPNGIERFDQFASWLLTQIFLLERHEAVAWFRNTQTGDPIFDPNNEEFGFGIQITGGQ